MSDSQEKLEMLAALVAAGAATPVDQRELDELLAADPAAAAEIRAFGEAASLLALELSPEEPPADAFDKIRAALRSEPPRSEASDALPAGVISLADRRAKRATVLATASAVAAAAFALLWWNERQHSGDLLQAMASQESQYRSEIAEQEARFAGEREALANAVDTSEKNLGLLRASYSALRSTKVQIQPLSGKSGLLANVFVGVDNRRWLVIAHELPALPADKDYQLWFVTPEGKAISAGLLELGPDGALTAAPDVPETLGQVRPALSLEPKGGSAQPTDILAVGELI